MSLKSTKLLRGRVALWLPCVIAVAAYWDPVALRGNFVYDDVASVINNQVVTLAAPWYEAFTRDFWGQSMVHPASHKSYRPITTLTLRANMLLSYITKTAGGPDHTYYFHVVNVVLHGINTGLVTETAAIVLGDTSLMAPLIAGSCFGIHPVHAEAVSNITSRGELLMTLFFLLAFLSYANHIPAPLATTVKHNSQSSTAKHSKKGKKASETSVAKPPSTYIQGWLRAIWCGICIYVLPFIFMALSLFSKEQGVTTLCSLVAFDFIQNHGSVLSLVTKLREGNAYSWNFLKRTLILALQTVSMAALRYWLNGESSPDFVYEQNPPGFTEDRFTRVFSVNWVYCLYVFDMVFPIYLAPDWSGDGIPLIKSLDDSRAFIVMLLWLVFLGALYSLVVGVSPTASKLRKDIRQVCLISFFAFLFLPFLLSSNLLVTTGLAKADRVIYLPLLGYCLIQGLMFKLATDAVKPGEESAAVKLAYAVFAIQFAFFGWKVHDRNLAWSSEYLLWTKAYQVNPLSMHTISNAGRVLAKNSEYVEAEKLLRPVKDVRTNGGNPNDTFLYSVTLGKLNRCEEALRLIDDAIEFILEEREEHGIRYDAKMSFHAQSSLIISRAFCTNDVTQKGRIMQQALSVDPTNEFALSQYREYLETLKRMHQQIQMNMPELYQPVPAMQQEMRSRGMSQEQIIFAVQEHLEEQFRHLQELNNMNRQQQSMHQNQEQIKATQQEMLRQQQRDRNRQGIQSSQMHGPPQPEHGYHNGRTQGTKPQEQRIPHNPGMPSQAQSLPSNQGMPPIEEFDSSEFDNMFLNEQQDELPGAKLAEEIPHHHAKSQAGMPPSDNILSREQELPVVHPKSNSGILGMPPIEEFENGGFEKMFLLKD
jgi:protein O-mannosyl-transferase